MITVYQNFKGPISSTQISNFLLVLFKGELYGIFFLMGTLLGLPSLSFWINQTIFFYENMVFYLYPFLLKIPQKWKITSPYCT